MNRQTRLLSQYELPPIVWVIFPPLMLLILIPIAFIEPQIFHQMLAKDYDGGVVEHLTVILLLPGIVAGLAVYIHYRKALPDLLLGLWVLMWTLACIYFAGEEMSWGQWYFGWETPDSIRALNDQQETNLHNMSSWFDQKPKILVELWIFLGGLILPLWNMVRNKPSTNKLKWSYWILPTIVCVPTAGLFTLVRFADWAPWTVVQQFGSAELREYYVAIFLSIYLLSIYYRLRFEDNYVRNKIES
ncbi:MAG: hypothetical protein V3R68_03510 [Gammaproteobacteria bacterium]